MQKNICLCLLLALLLVPHTLLAHTGMGAGGGFSAGFGHPFGGVDHILAMLAVGMWGAQLGSPALWLLPVAFPMMMALGGVLGMFAVPFPPIEPGIALSVIVLGSVILAAWKAPLPAAIALVAVFALFHGYAHGAELPGQVDATAYSTGFVLATGLIHLCGIGMGMVYELPHGRLVLRGFGGAVAIAGVVLGLRLF